MSTQIEITKKVINYLSLNGYRSDPVVDELIKEPVGGAHRDKQHVLFSTREVLKRYLEEFREYSREEIFSKRKEKFLSIGKQKSFKSFKDFSDKTYWIKKDNIFSFFKENLFKRKTSLLIVIALIFVGFLYLF